MLVKVSSFEYNQEGMYDPELVDTRFFDNIDRAQSWISEKLSGSNVNRSENHGRVVGSYIYDIEYTAYASEKVSHELKAFKLIKMEVL